MLTETEALKLGNKDSILGTPKLSVLYRLLRAVREASIPGQAAELGVYGGGSAHMICAMLPHRMVHLFDTFTGIPVSGEHDWHGVGDFNDTSEGRVRKVLENYENVELHVGYFPNTAAGLNERFCFAHCDGDQYQSTLDFLAYFYPRMSPGGIMVFDDFLWENCPGVLIALSEFLEDKPERLTVEQEYQAILVKE